MYVYAYRVSLFHFILINVVLASFMQLYYHEGEITKYLHSMFINPATKGLVIDTKVRCRVLIVVSALVCPSF